MIDVCGLCDLGYIGLDRTWERRPPNEDNVRIWFDRALATTGRLVCRVIFCYCSSSHSYQIGPLPYSPKFAEGGRGE